MTVRRRDLAAGARQRVLVRPLERELLRDPVAGRELVRDRDRGVRKRPEPGHRVLRRRLLALDPHVARGLQDRVLRVQLADLLLVVSVECGDERRSHFSRVSHSPRLLSSDLTTVTNVARGCEWERRSSRSGRA